LNPHDFLRFKRDFPRTNKRDGLSALSSAYLPLNCRKKTGSVRCNQAPTVLDRETPHELIQKKMGSVHKSAYHPQSTIAKCRQKGQERRNRNWTRRIFPQLIRRFKFLGHLDDSLFQCHPLKNRKPTINFQYPTTRISLLDWMTWKLYYSDVLMSMHLIEPINPQKSEKCAQTHRKMKGKRADK